jgi:hypothetical protein
MLVNIQSAELFVTNKHRIYTSKASSGLEPGERLRRCSTQLAVWARALEARSARPDRLQWMGSDDVEGLRSEQR